MDKRFGEVEQRVADNETSSQTSVAKLQKLRNSFNNRWQQGKAKKQLWNKRYIR